MFCNSTITDLFLFVFTQLILHYLDKLNESSVSDVQYLSKSNIFKPSKLNTNQITIENNDFILPLKLQFLENNHIISEMIIHI